MILNLGTDFKSSLKHFSKNFTLFIAPPPNPSHPAPDKPVTGLHSE
jgi:hypothetical protein